MARQSDRTSKPLQIASAKPVSVAAKPSSAADNPANADRTLMPSVPHEQSPLANQDRQLPIQNKPKAVEPEAVYFCGAATKKGTPCSRRVKVPGRCWQHVGQPSMIADTKVPQAK